MQSLITYEQTFDLLYDEQEAKAETSLDNETESILWNFNEGIGIYIEKILSGQMSINEMLKDHIAIIETWIEQVEETIANINQ